MCMHIVHTNAVSMCLHRSMVTLPLKWCLQVVKENVTSVIGIKDSLLDYTDRGLQNIQSEIKGMRHTLEELQKRDKILSTLRSDIRTIKASNKSLLYLQSEVKSIRRVEKE